MFDITLVTQSTPTACGPACLKMLLGYYGRDVALETLIEECHVSVDGCTAKDLINVGRAHGLNDMHAYKTSPDSVLRQDRPAILLWRHSHFVVYGGLNDAGEPMIYNPGRGVYAIDADSFEVMFSEIMLSNGRPEDEMPEDYFGEHEPEPDYFND